ncbi:hypothetical protein [Psychromarinibacter halotolerans]|uniref:Polyketide cyclase/dehydrase/lipid transport protein n=1 Tax=Psychromarinibacter halotolerans TaxID=1775175 RepID=A0ABV7GZW7_9RHOB|nr:hypothetical protein [Psychromarinibacter halotolerans]MDF0599013.1 hypothetical protein [Psychromarinibacter halotolerans]
MKRLAVALVAACLATATPAQERVLTPGKAAGFDGVISQCITFTRVTFAVEMCDRLSASVASLAQANDLALVDLGRTEWGFGSDVYLEPVEDTGMDYPVHLTFYIRGSDAPNSAFIWASLYKPTIGRLGPPGRLVLWEDSGLGAGDAATIRDGLTAGLAQKLAPVFEALGDGQL